MPDEPTKPTPNPLIQKLIGLPDQPASAVELVGFLGPIDANENVRLYLTLDLSASYQFPATNILYAEPPDPNDPTKPTKVLVDNKTILELVLSAEASFLEGEIAAILKLGNLKGLATKILKKVSSLTCVTPQGETPTKSGDDIG